MLFPLIKTIKRDYDPPSSYIYFNWIYLLDLTYKFKDRKSSLNAPLGTPFVD